MLSIFCRSVPVCLGNLIPKNSTSYRHNILSRLGRLCFSRSFTNNPSKGFSSPKVIYQNKGSQVKELRKWGQMAFIATVFSFGTGAFVLWTDFRIKVGPLKGDKVTVSSDDRNKAIPEVGPMTQKLIAGFLLGVIVAVYFAISHNINKIIKDIVVSTDRQTFSLSLYRLFGQNNMKNIPLRNVSLVNNTIKIRGKQSGFVINDVNIVDRKAFYSYIQRSKDSSVGMGKY
ncbi:unnamed protein product [Clavelina lepadiformis]|uniref:Transmembrane protein 223 n=1 Tax=Clavelina lepadiformis TaxID=159417 RepID=A0ABP0FFZ2_CLALP